MARRFKASAPTRLRSANTLGDGLNSAMFASKQGDDPVGFAQLLGSQHHCLISIYRHPQKVVVIRREERD